MTKLFAWLFAAALVIGLSSAPTLTYAEDPIEEAEDATGSGAEGEATSEDEASEDAVEEAEGE